MFVRRSASTYYIFGGTPRTGSPSTFPQRSSCPRRRDYVRRLLHGDDQRGLRRSADVRDHRRDRAHDHGARHNDRTAAPPHHADRSCLSLRPFHRLDALHPVTIAAGRGGTITTTGNTQTVTPATSFLCSTHRPDLLSVTPTTAGPLAPIQLTRVGHRYSVWGHRSAIFDGSPDETVSDHATLACP